MFFSNSTDEASVPVLSNSTWPLATAPDNASSWPDDDGFVNSTRAVECSNEYCISDDDYLMMIHDYVFPTPFEWTLTALYIIVFIVGLTGNTLVVYVVWRNANMRTVTNLFIVNLSVADILVIAVCLPATALVDITETWYLGLVMCKIVHYIQGVSVSVSVLTLTFISIERYFAIVHPLRFRATIVRSRVTIAAIWIVSCILLIPELIVLDIHRKWPPEFTRLLTVCRSSWTSVGQTAFQFILLVALYGLPLIIMAFAYTQIACRLWTSLATETAGDATDGINSTTSLKRVDPRISIRSSRCCSYDVGSRMRARRNVAKMLIVVVIIFAVCYLPVHLLNICRYARVRIDDNVVTYLALIAHWLCYFNSAINPVIYNLMSARFLKSFKRACRCVTRSGCIDCCHSNSCLRGCRRCRRRCRSANRHSTLSAMLPGSCRTHTAAVTSSSNSEPIQLGIILMGNGNVGVNDCAAAGNQL